MQVTIASFDLAQSILISPEHSGVTHLVSIGEPESQTPVPLSDLKIKNLRLEFDDITFTSPISKTAAQKAGFVVATNFHIQRLIAFFDEIQEDSKVLIHCAAGVSRSAAAACILFALKLGPGRERQATWETVTCKRTIAPNKHVIRLADKLLGRNGNLVKAAFETWPERY